MTAAVVLGAVLPAVLAQDGAGGGQAPSAAEQPDFYARQHGGLIARFYESADAMQLATPSAILAEPLRPPYDLQPGFPIIPRFERTAEVRRTTIDLPEGASIYGLGDVEGGLLRDGFSGEVPGLHAVVLVVLPDGSGFAAVADTSWPVKVSIGDRLEFESDAPTLPVLIVGGESLSEILQSFASLTGLFEMPPRWALRFGFEAPDAEAGAKALELAESLGHVGAVWVRTGDDPSGVAALAEGDRGKGLRVGISISECGADPVSEAPARLAGAFLHSPKADCAVPDLTSERGLEWWTAQVAALRERGVAGALVRWPQQGTGADTYAGDSLWGQGSAEQYTGIMARRAVIGARKGIAPDETGNRPWAIGTDWVLGVQRGGGVAVDAGEGAIARVLQLSLSGAPFVGLRGASVGEMAAAIACMPIAIGTTDEQGQFVGDQELLSKLLRVRARLEPYLYTLTFSAFYEGQPVVRPVFMADPSNAELRDVVDSFLLGPDLLVVPQAADGTYPQPPLKGWRKLDLGESGAGIPDFYLRPGRSLPTASPDQQPGEELDPLILIANVAEGQANSIIYEDSGEGYTFYRNDARRLGHRVDVQDGVAYVRLSQQDGGQGIPDRTLITRVLTDDGIFSGEGTEKGTLRIRLDAGVQGDETAPR